jgi:photosystem II stability/assembly factor-like uncharacterized protein
LLFPSLAIAQDWEVLGPSGGSFLGSVSDPADANVINAVTTYPSLSAAYGSTDGGQSWTKKGDIPYPYLYDFCAYDMSNLYAIGYNSCYISTDGGDTWATKTIPSAMGYPYTICVHPTDPDKIFVGAYYYSAGSYKLHVVLSSDGGDTWVKNVLASGVYHYPADIAISQSNPDVLYLCGYRQMTGGYGGYLYRCDDGGARWYDYTTSVEPTPLNNDFYCVAIDPTDENNVYVSGKALYSSNDSGSTWAKDISHTFNLESLAVDPVNPLNVYGASPSSVFVSKDGAGTWTQHTGVVAGYPAHIEVAPASNSTVYFASTYGGLFKTTDGGTTWGVAHEGMYTVTIASIAVAPSQPETVIADVASASRLVASCDCGDNWSDIIYPQGCSGTISELLIKSDNPNEIIALEAG